MNSHKHGLTPRSPSCTKNLHGKVTWEQDQYPSPHYQFPCLVLRCTSIACISLPSSAVHWDYQCQSIAILFQNIGRRHVGQQIPHVSQSLPSPLDLQMWYNTTSTTKAFLSNLLMQNKRSQINTIIVLWPTVKTLSCCTTDCKTVVL